LGDAVQPWVGTDSGWGGVPRSRDFIAAAQGEGWHVDRRKFDAILRETVCERLPSQHWISATRVAVVQSDCWAVHWTTASGDGKVCAGAAIDASGRARVVARAAGERPVRVDQLVAWHGTIDRKADVPLRTILEGGPDGWWYGSPLPAGRAAVCFLTDPDLVDRARVRTAALSEPARIIFAALGAEPDDWQPEPLPSGCSVLTRSSGAFWTAAGDAACAHDPLSGQGLDFAFRSGRRAAAAVAAALRADTSATAAYARMTAERTRQMLELRQAAYRLERRWPEHAFWQRRHIPPPHPFVPLEKRNVQSAIH
jgi:flavin-dependent dehydrogenase